jgi:hypothetical protein
MFEIDDMEKFWVGEMDEEKYTVYQMQSTTTELEWLHAQDGTELDPNFSEFSVRIHDPKIRSLSLINKTIAILPKSRLRSIYNLIGEYLNEIDKTETGS